MKLIILLLTTVSCLGQWNRVIVDTNLFGPDGMSFISDTNGHELMAIPFEQSNKVRIYKRIGTAPYWTNVHTLSYLNKAEFARFCHLDHDGIPDLVTFLDAQRQIFVHFGTVSNTWSSIQITNSFSSKTRWICGDVADMDGDGRTDIVAAYRNGLSNPITNGGIFIFNGPTNPRTNNWPSQEIVSNSLVIDLDIRDLDQNRISAFSIPNLVVSDRNYGTYWMEKVGTKWTQHWISSGTNIGLLEIKDHNLDYLPDLVECHGGNISIHYNHNNWRAWSSHTIPIPQGYSAPFHAVSGDIDNDGTPDLAVNGLGTGTGVYWIKSDGTFNRVSDTTGIKWDMIKVRDFNGDGFLDIMAMEQVTDNGLFIYLNPGY